MAASYHVACTRLKRQLFKERQIVLYTSSDISPKSLDTVQHDLAFPPQGLKSHARDRAGSIFFLSQGPCHTERKQARLDLVDITAGPRFAPAGPEIIEPVQRIGPQIGILARFAA